jgi:two-component system nitrogen regulation sensor histidine kinase NtrY
MTYKHFLRAILIRLVCLVGLTIFAAYLYFARNQLFWSIICLVIVTGLAINTVHYFNLINRWIASFLLGIENEDTTLRIPEKTGNKAIDEIFKGLHRLNELFRKTKIEIGTQEKYYLSIINQSATGLFSVNEQGRIVNINPAAERLTGLIAFHHVNTLKRIDDELPGFIMREQNLRESPSAIFENSVGQKLLFKLSEIRTPGELIRLVVVSDITKELDMREVDAWIKLARTLSHEIMNNIAPITTLSQVTLKYFLRDGQAVDPGIIDLETVKKTIKGLRVIEERSTGLKDFVENYRKFTKLPDPDFRKVDLTPLIGNVIMACSGFENYHKVKVEESLPDSIMTVTDSNLLSQVLINILKNALEHLGEHENARDPLIRIKLKKDANRIKIDICNNGETIPPELREQIFVPFFTTKENGTGIGLSLSKQIMLKLGGDIVLLTDSRHFTCFTVSLPQ